MMITNNNKLANNIVNGCKTEKDNDLNSEKCSNEQCNEKDA